jgi:hypothetical protein
VIQVKRLLILGVLLVSTLLVATAAADPIVAGIVVDENDNPVANAEVTAECDGATGGDYTADDGSYAIDFTSTTCDVGDTVYVTATSGDKTGSNSGTVQDQTFIEIAIVNVSIGIPEFTTVAIPAILTLGGYLATRKRRRKIE